MGEEEGKYLEGRAGGHPDLGDAGCHAEKHRDVRRERGVKGGAGGDPRDPDSRPVCRYTSAAYGHFYNPLPRSSVPLDSFDPLDLIHHLDPLFLSFFSFCLLFFLPFFLCIYVVYSLAGPLIPFNLVYWVQYCMDMYVGWLALIMLKPAKVTSEITK